MTATTIVPPSAPASLILKQAGAHATLLPERGGLLAELTLAPPGKKPASVLWLPDSFGTTESGWPGGGMPLLFPFAGRVFHEGQALHYTAGGKVLHMPLHGFAYAQPWTVEAKSEDHCDLVLISGPRTDELFPFDFTLKARYALTATTLTTTVDVTNQGAHLSSYPLMPVAMGWHPYFRVPQPELTRLESNATAKTRVTPVGGAGKTTPFPESEQERAGLLSDPLLQNLILGPNSSPNARLIMPDHALRLSWSAYSRYLVTWTQPGQGFHCVEPWMALPDALHNGDGIHWLKAGESLRYEFSIQIE